MKFAIFDKGIYWGLIALSATIWTLPAQTFTKITTGPVVTDTGVKVTTAWADFNHDGYLDAVIPVVGDNNFLYRNLGNGTFESFSSAPVTSDGGNSTAGSWGDYDNDGELDLLVVNRFQNHFLYRGLGGGSFAAVNEPAVLAGGAEAYFVSWVDYDNDGNLDLFVGNLFTPSFLYRNNGDGTFTKNTTALITTESANSIAVGWADYNGDGRMDVWFANTLYRNDGGGVFTVASDGPNVPTSGLVAAAWADYDNDGDLDLLLTSRNSPNFLFRNDNGSGFTQISTGDIVTEEADSNGAVWGDYDNDGWLDLYVANGDIPANQVNFLYRNNGNGTFTKIATGALVTDAEHSASGAWVDYDNDGDLDLHVANSSGGNSLYRNEGNANNWLMVRLNGTDSNRSAIGAKVRVTAQIDGTTRNLLRFVSGDAGFTSQNLELHFGLGNAAIINEVRVEWPAGTVQTMADVMINQRLTITESSSNSPSLVIPAGYENIDGNFYSGTLHEGQLRLQAVYGAANFPVGRITITELRFRRDINEPPFNSATAAATVRLSTTARNPGGLSTTFSENPGQDETTVFSGNWTYSSPTVVPQGTVRPFEIVLPLTTPFTYDPANGNLLFDIRITSNSNLNWTDGVSSSQLSRVASLNADAVSGVSEMTGDVIQFEYTEANTLVIPAGSRHTEGESFSGTLNEGAIRVQNIYGPPNFPDTPVRITELRFRRDASQAAFSDASATLAVKLSTTSQNPDNLSTTYAQNVGPDETTVFEGLWAFSSTGESAPGAVNPFDIVLPLTTPFTYDPAAGSLLVDFIVQSSSGAGWVDNAFNTGDASSRVFGRDPNGASATDINSAADVLQLVYDTHHSLTITPASGVFTNSVQVSIQSGVPNSVIRYTTDGSEPATGSTAYSGPFTLTETATVKARLFVNGFPASDIAEATYTRYVPPDVQFLPPGGLFTNQVSVALVNNVGAGTIRYTLNGSAPTSGSAVYDGPLNLTAGTTVRAQVYVNTFPVSDVFSESYARVYSFGDDGVPFAWREQYFGPDFLTDPCAAAGADCDDDGYVVLEEYQYSTDPTDGDSAPEIILTVRAVPRLTFTTVAGRSYRILRTETLNPPDWQTIVESVLATGPELHYVDEEAPDTSYYQIELIRD